MYIKSQSYIFLLALAVVGQCICIMVIQYYLTGGWKGEAGSAAGVVLPAVGNPDDDAFTPLGPIIAQFLNAIFILYWGEVFTPVALRLTESENHRTQTEFEDSLISKSFGFNFINAYASLFYVAFLTGRSPNFRS